EAGGAAGAPEAVARRLLRQPPVEGEREREVPPAARRRQRLRRLGADGVAGGGEGEGGAAVEGGTEAGGGAAVEGAEREAGAERRPLGVGPRERGEIGRAPWSERE